MGERDLVVIGGTASGSLAAAVARELGSAPGGCTSERFPDGEIHVEVDPPAVRGRRVIVVQSTSNLASDNLLELLFLADACRRAGATSISAVIPYFGYARQDRRKRAGEPLGVQVVAHVLGTARLDRIVTIDLHSNATEAALDVPVEQLSAVPLLADAVRSKSGADAVVVSPDIGGVRLAREYARMLALPLAVVHKVRRSGTEVDVERVAGDVDGLRPIIVDDIISTGSTIVAAARALQARGARGELVVAATHAVLGPGAMDRLRAVGVSALFVTDTIANPLPEPPMTVVSVAALLAESARRLSPSGGTEPAPKSCR